MHEPAASPSASRRPIGIDSYAYHRLLGETRPGEEPRSQRFAHGSLDVVVEARRLGADFALLETCFLGAARAFDAAAYREAASGLPLGLSWGAPEGFGFGERPEALYDLAAWAALAGGLGLPVLRIVAGGPAHAGRPVEPLVPLLRRACELAAKAGVTLALENHADLDAAGVERLLELVADGRLRVCFDTANALRRGDDVLAAARRLSEAIVVVHVKDCAGTWDDPTAGPVSLPLGEGVIPVRDVLDACPQAAAAVELGQLPPGADEVTLVAAAVDYLRAL